MDTLTEHPHVVRNAQILGGEPIIRNTRTSIRAIVEMWRAGNSPDEIITKLPHLTLAEVFDSLGYFEDHCAEILAHIDSNKIEKARLIRDIEDAAQ